jgi:hypothetical protein
MQFHTLSQFGNVSGGYNNQFGSQWISEY